MNHFSILEDPRLNNHKKLHSLEDILILTLLAVICGAESWVDVEDFGKCNGDWLKRTLKLPNGVPSHDTIGKVFRQLNPEQFKSCFLSWVQSLVQVSGGDIIAIDGKTLRHSYDSASNRAAIHMISAWSCGNELVLGQFKTEEKSNEITAIPELLKVLSLAGCTVTIDAMGCQKKIAKEIIKGGGDYVLALKENHKTLHDDVALYMDSLRDGDLKNRCFDYFETLEKGHGRIETRRHWVTEDIDWLEGRASWSNIKSIGMVERERQVNNAISKERHFYISSRDADAKELARCVRSHWEVENKLHWVLDVCFNEDKCRVRKDFGAENFAVVRHLAINLLRQENTFKGSLRRKRKKAGWDHHYLVEIMKLATTKSKSAESV